MYGAIDTAFRSGRQGTSQQVIRPVPELETSARAIGYVDTPTTDGSPTVMSVVPISRVEGTSYEFLALATLRAYLDSAVGKISFPTMNALDPRGVYRFYPGLPRYSFIPTLQRGVNAVFVPYLRSDSETFRRVSFTDVYHGRFASGTFTDTIVLVGATATALTDRVLTPSGQQPGVYVHASVIDGVLGGEYTTYVSS